VPRGCLLLFCTGCLALTPRSTVAQDSAALPEPARTPALLRWGADPTGGAPYVYQDKDGNFTGFEWELAGYLARKLGRVPEFRPGDWDKLPQRLDHPADTPTGIDIVLNGYELNRELAEDYAVSRPYFVYRLQLLAHRDNDQMQGWADLMPRTGGPRKSVGVLGGSAAHAYMLKAFADHVDLRINPDVATVMGLVQDRRMDATVQDTPAATYFLRVMPQLKAVGEPRQPGFYVIYLRQSDPELLRGINQAIADGIRDGTIKRIYEKYGLWTEDQERLLYWMDQPWPQFSANQPRRSEADPESADDSGVNPWPRMLKELIHAAGMTVFLSVTSFPLAMLAGMLIAVGRVYGPRLLSIPLGLFIEVIRGTPLMLQLYTVFYLLPMLLPGLALEPIQAGILGLAINYSAYEAENYRAGLLAVPRGQLEAALALGMTRWTALRRIVIPQAARIVIPPVTNDFIALFKDTSVCSVILITELTRKYNELYNFNREYIVELAFVTAGIYLMMSYPLALAAQWIERRLGTETGVSR